MQYGSEHVQKQTRKHSLANSLLTGIILLVASLLCEALYRTGAAEQNIIIVMVLAVFIIAAGTDGYLYGIASALVGVFIYDFLVTMPRLGFSFTIGFPVTLSIMLLVTLATTTITTRIKKETRLAREKEQRAELLYDINRKLLASRDEAAIARYAMDYLGEDLHRSIALYTTFDDPARPGFYFRRAEEDVALEFFASEAQWRTAALAAEQGQAISASTGGGTGGDGYYVPIMNQGTVYGVFGISCKKGGVPASHRPFLDLITEQTAQALRVQALTAGEQRARIRAETEKDRNSFLRSISHDLRTPLTSIIGASSTLLESGGDLTHGVQVQLVEGIQADSQWLLSMVENVLSVTRIHQNDMVIEKTEQAAEEIVGEAVALFRKRYPGTHIEIRQPEDLLLVPMDALLITQVLNNLLDNAQRHTGSGNTRITIEMLEQDGYARFIVSDNGPGIGSDVLPGLFALQPARAGHGEDASRGLGIGLSICKTIVEAHGGWVRAGNLPQGGARFTFALPLEPV